jgi:O-antigen/teichoic acid export membrane protein
MQVIGLLSGAILLRLLNRDDYGLFGLGLVISMFFARLKLWGLNSLIIAKTDPDDLDLSTQFWLSVGFSFGVLALVAAAMPLLRMFYDADEVLMTLLVTAVSILENEGLASTPENMLIRELRYGTLSTLLIISTLLSIGTTIVFALLGWGAYALLAGYAVKSLIYCGGVWLYAPRRPRVMFSMERARGLLREGRHLLWGGIGSFLAFKYDDLAVGTFTNRAMLGNYSKAYDLSLVPMSLVGGVLGIASATYAQVKDNRAALSEAVSFMLDAVALIVLPASVGLALIAREFIILYAGGNQWLDSVPMLQLLLLYSMVRPLNDAVGSLAPTLGRVEVVKRYGIVQSVVMVISCTALTLLWGANGAAISAGITVVVGFAIFAVTLLRPAVDIDYVGIFAPPLISVALGTGATIGASMVWLPDGALLALLYKGAIFSAVFGLCLLVVGRQALIRRITRIYGALIGKRPPTTAPGVEAPSQF